MSSLWLITTYFNPLHWSSRRRNYDIFRRHLAANLLTVEWSPSGQFQLTDGDADRLIQISGGDLMWQKERLINIGLEHLPDDCDLVGWVDCDILFLDPLWHSQAATLLETHDVVQLYSSVEYLKASSPLQPPLQSNLRRPSVIHNWKNAEDPPLWIKKDLEKQGNVLQSGNYGLSPSDPSMGFAWASRRAWLEAMGGLPDRAIVGSGDRHFVFAMLGFFQDYRAMLECRGLGDYCSAHTQEWALRAAATSPRISYLETTILHLNHGDLADRGYLQRLFDLVRSGFLPDEHLELDPGGAWRFSDAAPPGVREVMASYFASRREDNDHTTVLSLSHHITPGTRTPLRQ